MKNNLFQPGKVLHEAIDGAFRANGLSFESWCRENEIHPSTARNATFGQSCGERGAKLLAAIIEAAGRDLVEMAYRQRVIVEADRLRGTSPAQRAGAAA